MSTTTRAVEHILEAAEKRAKGKPHSAIDRLRALVAICREVDARKAPKSGSSPS